MSQQTIKLSDVKIEFGGTHPPKDEHLMELLKQAYKSEIMCHMAMIKVGGLVPFSDYKPTISDEYRAWFESNLENDSPSPIYTYPKGDAFIMSDDYNAYYLYLEKGYREVLCIVLGEAKGYYVGEVSEAFKLPPPTAEVINN